MNKSSRTWLRRVAWSVAAFAAFAPWAAAQTSGYSGSTGGGSTGGGGGSSSSMGGGGAGGSGGGSGASGANATSANNPAARTVQQGFTGGAQSGFIQTNTTGGGSVGSGSSGFNANSSSSPVASTYANPLYSGKPGASTQTGIRVGGFGANLYTWTAPQSNITGRVTNTSQTGMGGGMHNNMNISTTPGRRVAAYTSAVRFPVHTPNAAQLHTHARAAIASATTLPSYQNIQVALDGSTIVLRGRVADADERRLAENVLRLTPGIRDIRNELAVTDSPSTVVGQTP